MFLKIWFSLLCFHLINCNEIEVNTTSGVVKGKVINVLDETIDQFLGIPYAEPPLGSLRFAKPKPISKPIEGIIDGTVPKNSCQQIFDERMKDFMGNITTNEDCLVLNIWSPEEEDHNSTKLKPVMFWMYGGGLIIGSIFQPQYNGSVLATEDVVFLSVNYRLGIFGFMYTEDESVPGNMGFYDQLLALKWVRENIHLFGGDKNQITIFGESAGSLSVSAHLISPLTEGLFKRAIIQSGTLFMNKNRPIINKEEAIHNARHIAKQVNCTDDQQWLHCLRTVDAETLANIPVSIFITEGTEYLPISAQKAFSELKFNRDLELMAGITKDEGSTLAYNTNITLFNKSMTEQDFITFIEMENSTFHDLNAKQIVEFYLRFADKNSSETIKWKIYDFFGDLFLKCPTYLFAKHYAEQSNHTNVFFYELTHTARGQAYAREFGIFHGADIDFVFGIPLLQPNSYPKEDIHFTKQVLKYWTNFAKYGNPGNWQTFIDYGVPESVTMTKDLNPKNSNLYHTDLGKATCEGFWKDYFEARS